MGDPRSTSDDQPSAIGDQPEVRVYLPTRIDEGPRLTDDQPRELGTDRQHSESGRAS